jgi:hypothetical protein
MLPQIAKPEGRVHFAGEHASSLLLRNSYKEPSSRVSEPRRTRGVVDLGSSLNSWLKDGSQ